MGPFLDFFKKNYILFGLPVPIAIGRVRCPNQLSYGSCSFRFFVESGCNITTFLSNTQIKYAFKLLKIDFSQLLFLFLKMKYKENP